MDTTARTSHWRSALVALLSAVLIGALGYAERADSKRFSAAVIKSVSKKRLAGVYRGVTEQGTPVSFRLARSGKIVDFVVPSVTLSCVTYVADHDGDGTFTFDGDEIVNSIKPSSFKSASPVPGRKASPQYPFGTVFEYETPRLADDQPPPGTFLVSYSLKVEFKEELFSGHGANIYWPVPKRAAAMRGELFMGTSNGPLRPPGPGREHCSLSDDGRIVTHVNALDFDAKKVGR
jgi:hypothetical protein